MTEVQAGSTRCEQCLRMRVVPPRRFCDACRIARRRAGNAEHQRQRRARQRQTARAAKLGIPPSIHFAPDDINAIKAALYDLSQALTQARIFGQGNAPKERIIELLVRAIQQHCTKTNDLLAHKTASVIHTRTTNR